MGINRYPFFLFFVLAFYQLALAQDKLTAEEEKAVVGMRHRFNDALDANKTLVPLIPTLFVSDFAARDLKERKASEKGFSNVVLAPGIFYDSKLLSEVSEDDWRRALTATYDIMIPVENATLNLMSASLRSKKEPDAGELETLVMRVFPASVSQLFAKDETLKNFIQKDGGFGVSPPIHTANELRRVTDTLEKAIALMKKDEDPRTVLTPDAHSAREMFVTKPDSPFSPRVSIADRDTLGFPVGTRIITFFASPMTLVAMVEVGTEYKIAMVRPASPD